MNKHLILIAFVFAFAMLLSPVVAFAQMVPGYGMNQQDYYIKQYNDYVNYYNSLMQSYQKYYTELGKYYHVQYPVGEYKLIPTITPFPTPTMVPSPTPTPTPTPTPLVKTALTQSTILSELTPTPKPKPGSIQGLVTISPVACDDKKLPKNSCTKPYQTIITVKDEDDNISGSLYSDKEGKFKIDVLPGVYTVIPSTSSAYPKADPQKVSVSEGLPTQIVVQYDSGIKPSK